MQEHEVTGQPEEAEVEGHRFGSPAENAEDPGRVARTARSEDETPEVEGHLRVAAPPAPERASDRVA